MRRDPHHRERHPGRSRERYSPRPRIPGHEFAGVVDAVGDEATTVAEGNRVLGIFYLVCERCDACRRGDSSQCTNFGGYVGVHRGRAYAKYVTVPAGNALPVHDETDFAAGEIVTDGLATPLHVCRRANVTDTDTVLVIGAAGRIGVHLSQLANGRGATVLTADVDDERLAHVNRVTDDHVVPIDVRGDDSSNAWNARRLSATA